MTHMTIEEKLKRSFDTIFTRFSTNLVKFGNDDVLTNRYRDMCVGIAYSLGMSNIISNETINEIHACLYFSGW